jgi:hypothetical protein
MAKYCKACGAKLEEDARFCAECGAPVAGGAQQSDPGQGPNFPGSYYTPGANRAEPSGARPRGYVLSILAVVFGVLGGWLGLLFGVIGLCLNKPGDTGVQTRCIIGIALAGVWIFFWRFIGLALWSLTSPGLIRGVIG